MAEARSAVSEPRVDFIEEGHDTFHDAVVGWRRSFCRRFHRTKFVFNYLSISYLHDYPLKVCDKIF